MSEITAAPSSEKEPLTSSVMYLDRIRSEMLLRLETMYWKIGYNYIKPKERPVCFYPSMGSLVFQKLRESAMVFFYPNFSCKTSVQCCLVYNFETDDKYSQTVFAEYTDAGKYTIKLPAALIHDKRNKCLKNTGCIILGIRYNSRRLLNTEVGLYLIRSDQTENFLEAYRKRLFTDFIIRAGGKEFHVHKAIFSARSIHFLRNVPSTKSEIVLDARVKTVQNVIHYLYSGKLPPLTLNEMIDVYEVSVTLYIPSLMNLCEIYFLDTLNVSNAKQIKKIAMKTGNQLLIKAAKRLC